MQSFCASILDYIEHNNDRNINVLLTIPTECLGVYQLYLSQ